MKDQEHQLDLSSVATALRQRWWLLLATALVAGGLAFGLSYLQPERYESSADLLFREPEAPPRVDPNEPPPDRSDAPERVAATNLALASLDRVAVRVKQRLDVPFSINELRDRVELSPAGQADIVTITAKGNTAEQSAQIANAFASEVVALRRQNAQARVQDVIEAIQAQLAANPTGATAAQLRQRADQLQVEKRLRSGDVEIAQTATIPRQPSSPKPLRNGLVGGGLGLILGFLLALLLHRLDRRVDSEEEIPEIVGAPVIARIPEEKATGWERELFAEAFQFLRANLQLQDPDRNRRVIAVTSALPGNGKSTVSARLAESFALTGSEVILVDFDLRRPILHEYFGTGARDGVTTALVGLRDPVELLQETKHPGIRLLAAGPLVPVSASVMAGEKPMNRLLSRLRESADYVIVDTSPITIGAEASAVAAATEGTLVVVDAQSARRDVLRVAIDQLRASRAELLGVVLNRAEAMLKEEAYRGYYSAGATPLSRAAASEDGPGDVQENGSRRGLLGRVKAKP